jgi:hypothetical protein
MIPIAANLMSRIKAKLPGKELPKNALGFKSLRLFIQMSHEITSNAGDFPHLGGDCGVAAAWRQAVTAG